MTELPTILDDFVFSVVCTQLQCNNGSMYLAFIVSRLLGSAEDAREEGRVDKKAPSRELEREPVEVVELSSAER